MVWFGLVQSGECGMVVKEELKIKNPKFSKLSESILNLLELYKTWTEK